MKGCYATNAEIQDFFRYKKKPSMADIQRVRSHLQEDFLQGEETGNNANPSDVVPKIKRL